jgi:hypothetical protein
MKWNSTAGPIQAKRVIDAWAKLSWAGKNFIEITGIIGGEERRTTLANLFGPPLNKTALAEMERIGTKYAWKITVENFRAIIDDIAKSIQVTVANLPIEDRRQTPAQVDERHKETEERSKKNEAERLEIEKVCNLGETPPALFSCCHGNMVVEIGACTDCSDIMTDYFDRHHPLTGNYALALVHKGAQTEAVARSVVNQIPELASLTWEWHQEAYSGGNGYYLQSGVVGRVPYRGEEKAFWYEISMNKWLDGKEVVKSRLFLSPTTAAPGSAVVGEGGNGVKISRNEEHNGIEIRFPAKPAPSVIDHLKAGGFRWSRPQSLWYTKYTPEKLTAIQSFFGA